MGQTSCFEANIVKMKLGTASVSTSGFLTFLKATEIMWAKRVCPRREKGDLEIMCNGKLFCVFF